MMTPFKKNIILFRCFSCWGAGFSTIPLVLEHVRFDNMKVLKRQNKHETQALLVALGFTYFMHKSRILFTF